MDLQISVFLLLILFTAGHTLSCYKCMSTNGTCAKQTEELCTNGASSCSSLTTVSRDGNQTYKGCTTDCQHGSQNIGISKMATFCCNTDLCNVKDAPDDFNIPNGKKCFSCDGQNCTNILKCTGSEDRCFKYEGENLEKEEVLRCCEGNLCNGGANNTSFTQNTFLFFCCSLLYFLLQ
ncbi:hypothetical protein F2P79_015321 [Pimephales promelas]|nr:hypothetical protein F2P79_015321 [Pimephales promelas]